jgi:four helix bundle protein
MRLKIARKEAKEASYWLRLIKEMNSTQDAEVAKLLGEAIELKNILSSIINQMSRVEKHC